MSKEWDECPNCGDLENQRDRLEERVTELEAENVALKAAAEEAMAAYRGRSEYIEALERDVQVLREGASAANARADAAEKEARTITQYLLAAEAEAGKYRTLAKKLWPAMNARRCNLITLKQFLTPSEASELAGLQALADEYMNTMAPLPIAELEAYVAALQEGPKEGE